MSYPGVASFSVTATNYGRNAPDSYYALAGSTGGIPPGPVEITGTLTVDGNATFKQAVTCEAAVEIQGALTGAAATFSGALTGAGATFSGNVTSATGTVTGALTANAVGATSAVTCIGDITGGSLNTSGDLAVEGDAEITGQCRVVGPFVYRSLKSFNGGNTSNPITSGQLQPQGVLQLTWSATNSQYEGTFTASNIFPLAFLVPTYGGSSPAANTYGAPVISSADSGVTITITVASPGSHTAGDTVNFAYLFIQYGSPF